MKTSILKFIAVTFCLLAFSIASAGQITVKVVNSQGSSKSGAKVSLSIDGGGVTDTVRTNSSGVAVVKWSSSGKSGKIFVNGSTKHSGSFPSSITIRD